MNSKTAQVEVQFLTDGQDVTVYVHAPEDGEWHIAESAVAVADETVFYAYRMRMPGGKWSEPLPLSSPTPMGPTGEAVLRMKVRAVGAPA